MNTTREEKLQKAHQMFDNRNLLTELKWQRNYFNRGYVSKQEELFNLWIFDECIKAIEQEQYYKDLAESYEKTINKLTKAIEEQEPRKGMRWIGRFETHEWGKEEWCECPWCHMDSAEAYNFCPNCGADFREGVEE